MFGTLAVGHTAVLARLAFNFGSSSKLFNARSGHGERVHIRCGGGSN